MLVESKYRSLIDMEIEIKVNGKLWIEIELEDALGKSMVKQLDAVFSKIATDKNRVKIKGFVRDPKALR